jgi:diguanylate cyclase (GGDEF)-like protein/PAS domain S-box-containing protein
MNSPDHRRILVVDDNPEIHKDLRKILCPESSGASLDALEAEIFGAGPAPSAEGYSLESAFQGQEALECVRRAVADGRPFALAFVDMRMPPGWDGLETIAHLWRADPDLQVVICTAYTEHSREEIVARTGRTDRLVILKKPFHAAEIEQLACAMTEKWRATRQARLKLHDLEDAVRARTAEIAAANARLREQVEELEEMRRALERSEERYALAARGANDGLWDWDLVTGTIYFSERWKAIVGLEPREDGDTLDAWLQRIHPNDVAAFQGAIREHAEGRRDHLENEHRVRTRGGAYKWVLCRGMAVRDAPGKPCRMAGSISDISSRKETEEQLRRGAYYDRLTGLPNRALLRECIERAIAERRGGGGRFAVLFLDFDRFKLVNDSMGHMAGDQLLIGIAARLSQCAARCRPPREHTIARLGGDEFVVLLRSAGSESEVRSFAATLQTDFQAPFEVQGNEVHLGASVGIAMDDGAYATPDEVLRDADTAMYHAKAHGGSRDVVFSAAMRESAVARLRLENDLRRAIQRGEIRVVYQPIVSLKTGATTGLEALARWEHPDHGGISPERFIPIAEETGLILPLGEHVLQTACRDLRSLRSQNPAWRDLRVSVNMSARQFAQPGLIDTVLRAASDSGLDSRNLSLEVTETAVMDDFAAAAATIRRLRDQGIGMYMDDFGTGYSSLSCLKSLPLSGIKLDRYFVAQLEAGTAIPAIIHAVVTLASHLRLGVIAEGIETRDQLASLLALECDEGQGYLFGRPMPVGQVAAWLARPPLRAAA